MVKALQVLALIPARGGSKGIPRKNIRNFAGYPLIAYSIAAGLQAKCVQRVIVSTDDDEIAAVGRAWGAETPFLRPPEISQDQTQDFPVFTHALGWLKEHEGYEPDVVVQLRPTSPIRPRTCVDDAVQILVDHADADSVRGVVPAGQNPHKMWRIDTQTGTMSPLLKVEGIDEPYNAPRQALPPIYWQTGHIDAIRTSTIYEKNSLSGNVVYPLLIDPRFTVDIDNLFDWQRAEYLVANSDLDMVNPGLKKRSLPEHPQLVVFDFDGVMTDNRVWVDKEGHEFVAAYRSDSLGLKALVAAGIKVLVLSQEVDGVVSARCRKVGVPVLQGIEDKATALKKYMHENQVDPQKVIYLGNDVNDLPCFPLVGCAVVVADALPEAAKQADMCLTRPGGHGAVRELCDLILKKF